MRCGIMLVCGFTVGWCIVAGCSYRTRGHPHEHILSDLHMLSKVLRRVPRDARADGRTDTLLTRIPRGNLRELEEWLSVLYKETEGQDLVFTIMRTQLVRVSECGRITLIDCWGQPLIYQSPAEDHAFVFRLYSCGPNGIDENGQGDDLDVSILHDAH